jgi:hypothetical protein
MSTGLPVDLGPGSRGRHGRAQRGRWARVRRGAVPTAPAEAERPLSRIPPFQATLALRNLNLRPYSHLRGHLG